jgi:hypothetical protein
LAHWVRQTRTGSRTYTLQVPRVCISSRLFHHHYIQRVTGALICVTERSSNISNKKANIEALSDKLRQGSRNQSLPWRFNPRNLHRVEHYLGRSHCQWLRLRCPDPKLLRLHRSGVHCQSQRRKLDRHLFQEFQGHYQY